MIVTELSRIARSTSYVLSLVERFEKHGISFRCLSPSQPQQKPGGRAGCAHLGQVEPLGSSNPGGSTHRRSRLELKEQQQDERITFRHQEIKATSFSARSAVCA